MLEHVASPDFTDDALLLTSEIVSNATVVGGGCRLSAWYRENDGALRIEVHDDNAFVPSLPAPQLPDKVSGRGLRIVDTIASRWGVDRDGVGKSVWFEMYRGGKGRPNPISG